MNCTLVFQFLFCPKERKDEEGYCLGNKYNSIQLALLKRQIMHSNNTHKVRWDY
jgi:hypothetical protein